jgi:hypothetical protein
MSAISRLSQMAIGGPGRAAQPADEVCGAYLQSTARGGHDSASGQNTGRRTCAALALQAPIEKNIETAAGKLHAAT